MCFGEMIVTDSSAPTLNSSIDLKDLLLYLSCPYCVGLRLGSVNRLYHLLHLAFTSAPLFFVISLI